MKLEDLNVGSIIMRADRKENILNSGDTFATPLHRNGIEVVDFIPEE